MYSGRDAEATNTLRLSSRRQRSEAKMKGFEKKGFRRPDKVIVTQQQC